MMTQENKPADDEEHRVTKEEADLQILEEDVPSTHPLLQVTPTLHDHEIEPDINQVGEGQEQKQDFDPHEEDYPLGPPKV